MGSPRSGPLSAPPAPPTAPPPATQAAPQAASANPALAALQLLRGAARRLRPAPPAPGEGSSGGGGGRLPRAGQEALLAAGRRLREAREARGLGMRQLAQATRISIPVIEALERGWPDRLPEPTYLRVMLPLLEQQLELPAGSLAGALPQEVRPGHGPQRQALLRRHTPGSIEVFSSWQGTLLYGLLTLLLVYGLNLQQRRLAAQGAHSLVPLAPLPLTPQPAPSGQAPSGGAPAQPEPARDALLQAYPELQPLDRAAAGQALALLRREQASPAASAEAAAAGRSLGLLRLRLPSVASLRLESRGGPTQLNGLRGDLSLPVLPPFQLELSTAPEGPVLWNGAALAPSGRRGAAVLYRWPARP